MEQRAQAAAAALNAPAAPVRQAVQSNAIPVLNQPAMTLNFGKMDSDYSIINHTIRIENQDTLSGLTYDQLAAVSNIQLNMTRAQFIRIWKTLIYKRVQDILMMEKQVRPVDQIHINRAILTPAPLADLLASLGEFHSAVTGHIHHIVLPDRAARAQTRSQPAVEAQPVPEHGTINRALLTQWNLLCARLKHNYIMKEFPPMDQESARPLVLTRMQATNDLIQIRAKTSEPTPNDALIRIVNDDLFVDNDRYDYAHCAITMTPLVDPEAIRGTYVGGYVLDNNA